MQNIADNFANAYSSRSYEGVEGVEDVLCFVNSFRVSYLYFCANMGVILVKTFADALDTFIVYNERRKVTSSAKKRRRHGDKSLHQVIID